MLKRLTLHRLVAISFVVLAASSPLKAANTPTETRFHVRLQVTGDDVAVVKSDLSRDLRKLGDVDVTEGEAEHTLYVVVVEMKNRANNLTGYVISSIGFRVLITEDSLRTFPDLQRLSAEQKQALAMFAGAGVLEHHFVQTVGPGELESLCSELVAQYDTAALEPIRQTAKATSP